MVLYPDLALSISASKSIPSVKFIREKLAIITFYYKIKLFFLQPELTVPKKIKFLDILRDLLTLTITYSQKGGL